MRKPSAPTARHCAALALALLLAAPRALAQQAAADLEPPRPFSRVSTPQRLREAIKRGDRHIEITSHMVLSDDVVPRDEKYLFGPKPTTQSIRGDCRRPLPSWSTQLQPPVVARDGFQCLLLAEEDTFFWDHPDGTDTYTTWMHNLYLRLQRGYGGNPRVPRASLMFWRPSRKLKRDASKLFLTDSILQGDGLAGARPFWSENARSLLHEVQIRDGNEDSAVFAFNAPVSLSNTRLHSNNCTDAFAGGSLVTAGALKIGSVTSVRFGDSSSVTTTTGWELLLQEENSTLFTDVMSNGSPLRQNPASLGALRPLSALPAQATARTNFLTRQDPDYLRILEAETAAAREFAEPEAANPGAPANGGGNDGLSDGVIGAIAGTAAFIALVVLVMGAAWLVSRRRERARHADDPKPTGMAGGGGPVGHLSLSTPTASKRSYSNPTDPARFSGSGPSTEWTSLRALELANNTPGSQAGSVLGRTYARGTPSVTCGAGGTAFTMASVSTEATMAGGTWRQQLLRALNNMRVARPPQPFAGRYLLLRERAGGGQAVIAFARDREGGYFQYAVKFFRRLVDFEIEAAFYRHPRIRAALPQVFHGGDNTDLAIVSPGGFVYPPFLVLERGSSLPKWMEEPRAFPSVLNMFHDLAMQLDVVHGSGYVHRDLKPANVLLMLQTQCWKLIDFGIAAQSGIEAPAHCTVAYAAPEVLIAHSAGGAVLVEPAQDIWALGCMVYECLTEAPAVDPYHGQAMALAMAQGEAPYPWEEGGEEENPMFARSRARTTVLACLSRDPTQRPSAEALLHFIDRMGTTGFAGEDTARGVMGSRLEPQSAEASPLPSPGAAASGFDSRFEPPGAPGAGGGGVPGWEESAGGRMPESPGVYSVPPTGDLQLDAPLGAGPHAGPPNAGPFNAPPNAAPYGSLQGAGPFDAPAAAGPFSAPPNVEAFDAAPERGPYGGPLSSSGPLHEPHSAAQEGASGAAAGGSRLSVSAATSMPAMSPHQRADTWLNGDGGQSAHRGPEQRAAGR